nr:MAG TPA: hypothetical protein [Caudoviricetes sp.]DAT69737.1 MAG TPA: hypothetical protein [Caudoviricetes sp.]
MVTKDKKVWEIATNENGEEFTIMSESEYRRDVYRLYKMQNGEWIKTSQSEDPSTFDELIFGGQDV